MSLLCYNYKKARLAEGVKILEKAIHNDDHVYMLDTIRYTSGLNVNYEFKPTIFKKL